MPLKQNDTIPSGRRGTKEPDLPGVLKYEVERKYSNKRTFDEVLARICLVYMDQQRNLGGMKKEGDKRGISTRTGTDEAS